MRTRRNTAARFFLAILFLAVFSAAGGVSAAADSRQLLYKEVESELMCADTCGMHLPSCDNETAQEMRGQILDRIDAGYDKQEILQWFIDIYGVGILAYPPRSGFNLTAWVFPFISLLGGGLTVYLLLNKWVLDTEERDEVEDKEEIDLDEYNDLLMKEQLKYL